MTDERIASLHHRKGSEIVQDSVGPQRAACEVFLHDDAIVVCVSHALDGHFGSFGDVEFESKLAKRHFDDFGCAGVGTNQGRFIAQFKKLDFF